ncbi:MAG: C-GCAxxG-C-C family protein [Candidatus Cloacimonadaceae bacterium]|nr:C-GCAxxG-C-C family protein [Candidatus Cloacimonadota bacterium]MDY0126694.1 C-GCAxxG-C-C family protein [Candidatus Cloacimonadaceae bacterium]MCB5255587.1 C-GCAxxG-C-C family protein [Candidatus Cloacimonadota bacterium]MCK9177415.1 C-GCAxxG-C-C family protein [Candidatus Cloacimonadota bacterium]MCK9241693.1 C-GCAxxG-C-C family protein [Candidatus Cloacimonadota bacterium]
MSKAEIANLKHQSGFNCAQSVLSVFAEDFGLPLELAMKLASSFGGGMKMAATCGALTGALMALGLACGYFEADDEDQKAASDEMTMELLRRWQKEIGPTDCKTILGYDVSDPAQRELAIQAGALDHHCPKCIGKGAEILADLLAKLN